MKTVRISMLIAMLLTLVLAASGAVAKDKAGAKSTSKDVTVETIYAKRAELNKKTVTVKGKVVKMNAGIMGKTWIHIQDGTGAPGSNDLTITTADTPDIQVGDSITATGTVAADKDFGGGYLYTVIIENAKVSKTK